MKMVLQHYSHDDIINIKCLLTFTFLFLEDIMQPKAERPPVCPKGQLPQLHLTPSVGGQKRNDVPQQTSNNPWLLKPQHEIPPTPPPQADSQPPEFFPQRIM